MSPKKKVLYTEQQLKDALNSIRKRKMSIREASRKFSIPRSTLQDKVSGKLPEKISKHGPPTVLTTQEENRIVEWCKILTKNGFPIRKNNLLDTVKEIVAEDGRKTPFVNGRPSRRWYELFMKRHPELRAHTQENLTRKRTPITENKLLNWLENLSPYLEQIKQENPDDIGDEDEAGLSVSIKSEKVE